MNPPFLPFYVAGNFRRMVAENLLSEREKNFFTDNRLSKFWESVDEYLSDLPCVSRSAASDFLIGSFLSPLKLYGKAGAAKNPSTKRKIRDRQNKGDKLIEKAAKQARELSATLQELKKTTTFYPDTTRFTAIAYSLLSESETKNFLSYSDGIYTYEAIDLLEKSLREYPRASDLFNDVPGMRSNKSSWCDWLSEVRANLDRLLLMYPGEFNLREADWVALSNVLVSEFISRDSIKFALSEKW